MQSKQESQTYLLYQDKTKNVTLYCTVKSNMKSLCLEMEFSKVHLGIQGPSRDPFGKSKLDRQLDSLIYLINAKTKYNNEYKTELQKLFNLCFELECSHTKQFTKLTTMNLQVSFIPKLLLPTPDPALYNIPNGKSYVLWENLKTKSTLVYSLKNDYATLELRIPDEPNEVMTIIKSNNSFFEKSLVEIQADKLVQSIENMKSLALYSNELAKLYKILEESKGTTAKKIIDRITSRGKDMEVMPYILDDVPNSDPEENLETTTMTSDNTMSGF